MVSAVARAYNEGLGAEPPAGSKGRAPGQGGIAPPPEAEAHLVFGRLMEVTNLPTFLQFGNAKKPDICVIFCPKNISGHETGGDLERDWEKAVPPSARA